MPELSALIPTPRAVLDFAAGTYTLDGVAVLPQNVLASDDDWDGNFDVGDIVPGLGYRNMAEDCGIKLSGALNALLDNEDGYVILYEFHMEGGVSVDFYDDPNYESEVFFSCDLVGSAVMRNPSSPASSDALNEYNLGTLGRFSNRVAILYRDGIFAVACGIAPPMAIVPAVEPASPINTRTVSLTQQDILEKIVVFDAVDLVTLGYMASQGIDLG